MSAEADLGAAVVASLTAAGWSCFCEVRGVPGCGAARADIVAVKGLTLWVVETKLRLGWNVIAQARRWVQYAHYVSVATASGPTGEARLAAEAALAALGLGWTCGLESVSPLLRPCPPRAGILLDALRPEQCAARPGNATGEYWTEYADRCRRLAIVVAAEPGIGLERALRAAGWPTDPDTRRDLARQIRRGCVDRVRAGQERGKQMVLVEAPETF